MNTRSFNQLKDKHVSNNKATNKNTNALVNTLLANNSWIVGRMPTDKEMQETYENCGEYIFSVAIPNPNPRHAKANNRPYVVREGFACLNMSKACYEWHICSEDALSWVVSDKIVAWQAMPKAPVFK